MSLKTIDRYVARIFANYFILVILGVVVLFAFVSRIGEIAYAIGTQGFSFGAFRESFAQIPPIVQITLPLVLMLSAALTLLRLTNSSELVIMRAMGMSRLRILRPLFVCCIPIAILVYALQSYSVGIESNFTKLKQRSNWSIDKSGFTYAKRNSTAEQSSILAAARVEINSDFRITALEHHTDLHKEQGAWTSEQHTRIMLLLSQALPYPQELKRQQGAGRLVLGTLASLAQDYQEGSLYIGFTDLWSIYQAHLKNGLPTVRLWGVFLRKIAYLCSVFFVVFLAIVFTHFNPRQLKPAVGFLAALLIGLLFALGESLLSSFQPHTLTEAAFFAFGVQGVALTGLSVFLWRSPNL